MDSIFHHPPPSEDYVSYSLYFPPPSPSPDTNNADTKNDSINDYIKFLQENIVLILSELNQFLNGYIWQKESFRLRIIRVIHFCMVERYLVNVLKMNGLSVTDNDGEFLLIEAAMQIPSWMEPNNTENRIKQNIHHARCHIPRSIAHILYNNPQLIAPAVEAFYTRDPIALKACQKMEKFHPSTSITVTVKFTKTLYAQIVHQNFNPPKPFKLPPRTSNKFPAAELGMKLACGFEILCSDKYYTKLPTRSKDINIEVTWRIFHANLLARDYYRGNLPGSNAYKKLDEIAKEQFLQNKILKISSEEDDDNEMEVIKLPVEQINEILDQPMIPDEVLITNLTEDDESWLKTEEEELNTFDLSDMIDKLEGFINDENAGIEGAEFSDEHYSDGDYDDFDDFDMDDKNNQINFNPSNFLRIMKETLGLTDEEYREMANVKIKQQQNVEEFPTDEDEDDEVDEDELNKPVNINLNLAANVLESFKAQQGLPGPIGNLIRLPYVKPEPLLYTSGTNWEYQPDPSLKQILRRELKNHYENFILGRFDKLNIPLYLFLSGAGTGKSRNANEFHQTAITCLSAQEDEELLTRIKESWVFLVSYETGLALRSDESNPYLSIVTRMLFQLLREKMMFHEIIRTFKPPDALNVVTLIAKHHNRDLKNVTVILVVDGMQQLMENKDDGLKLNSKFYKTLTFVADLAFTIDKEIIWSRSLKMITNTLAEDCGGHGRALETLNDFLAGRNIEECNINTLMNDLRYNLTENLLGISNEGGDPLLRDWEFSDYGEQRALLNPVTLQVKSWQSFESFVASFRCIKSAVIEEDELTTISEVHVGARLNGDIQFKNHNLRLEIAKHHTDTKSKSLTASEFNVDCHNSTIDVRQFKHCIINAPAAPYGDSFLH
ncbi:1783_t:CDS:10 [Diversispora eburnea]|uniref:1783_t:CDS:1 n=1 Tax=Diversispora eburnea TaxID=1213867 RepID=A0A9N8YMB1_9GLOM|nr:1783_t:CDS:10 [Diversispora eburnea]